MIPKILLPNEHGAWGMFLIAFLLGGLAVPEISGRPLLILPAAASLFLVRYPVGIYFKKRRVVRALKIPLTREKWWFGIYAALTAVTTFPLLYPLGWWWLVPFGLIAAGLLALHLWSIVGRKERTFFVEETAMIGISLLAPAASYATLQRLHPVPVAAWLLLVLFNTWRLLSVRAKVARKKEVPVDFRGLGKRELLYSFLFLIAVVGIAQWLFLREW